jgi:two-component system, HptB-dependent secretion and biofilm response regulator
MTVLTTPIVTDRGLALIVDDMEVNRKVLRGLLEMEGYRTIAAANGEEAVRVFNESHPDIVFMDVMMPVMDGYQATARIKELSGTVFLPVIFLTALSEVDALAKCVEAGGDDFLSKPFRQDILRAKIKAMERIRGLSRKVAEQHRQIENQHQLMLNEQIIAEQIYSRAIIGDNLTSGYIHSLLHPMSVFSGDMLLTAKCLDGNMHILLGDFTGHGLSAAVGVLPTAEIFRAMTDQGFSAPEILRGINSKLHKLLPTGMFLTACFVVIKKDMQRVLIWNAGMPEALVLGVMPEDKNRQRVKHRVVSSYLPLGILPELDQTLSPVQLEIADGDRILICSDGVTEAHSANGDVFGMARYEQAATADQHSFRNVTAELEAFCSGQPYRDDVSLVEIHCVPGLFKNGAA